MSKIMKTLAGVHVQSFSFGAVDEYNADRQYNFTAHVNALLTFLENISQHNNTAFATAHNLRVRFNSFNKKGWYGLDHINLLNKDIRAQLSNYAPDGYFFGNAHANSNFVGFWPCDWLKPMHQTPTNAQLRELPKCVYQVASSLPTPVNEA